MGGAGGVMRWTGAVTDDAGVSVSGVGTSVAGNGARLYSADNAGIFFFGI